MSDGPESDNDFEDENYAGENPYPKGSWAADAWDGMAEDDSP